MNHKSIGADQSAKMPHSTSSQNVDCGMFAFRQVSELNILSFLQMSKLSSAAECIVIHYDNTKTWQLDRCHHFIEVPFSNSSGRRGILCFIASCCIFGHVRDSYCHTRHMRRIHGVLSMLSVSKGKSLLPAELANITINESCIGFPGVCLKSILATKSLYQNSASL